MSATLLPTVPGYSAGIVSLNPVTVQCHDCGATQECPRTVDLILSGYRFHSCEFRKGGSRRVRRCPDCLAAVLAACTERRHS